MKRHVISILCVRVCAAPENDVRGQRTPPPSDRYFVSGTEERSTAQKLKVLQPSNRGIGVGAGNYHSRIISVHVDVYARTQGPVSKKASLHTSSRNADGYRKTGKELLKRLQRQP